MTTYTADDFVKASFARHPDGNVAMRHWQHWAPSDEQAESVRFSLLTHDDMAADGWVPVQEARPLTIDEVPDALVVAMLEALGCRQDGKRVSQHPALLVGRIRKGLAAALAIDTTRPEGAEGVESQIEQWLYDEGPDDPIKARDLRSLADFLAERGVRVTGDAS